MALVAPAAMSTQLGGDPRAVTRAGLAHRLRRSALVCQEKGMGTNQTGYHVLDSLGAQPRGVGATVLLSER